jgi:hypothetical protein
LYNPVDKGIKSVISAMADIFAGMDIGAPLTHDNRPGVNPLASEDLHAQPLAA